ncbi:hypothetical protein ASPZODRAFT_18049 [Penicilliopsis zonata CBS 506.65]|uniref:Cytochrome P450 monooxygenase n=1 Tax=Penicilliopsis zonata CBS 506.65 TaxID=1073090 RepID=A0A1L9SD43_9EURO|nr:hypothetical protein ASPZODRAFT_18049 [Penicilliopsis zonata CBS 506.65]OJJ45140.1 hypothetical protein ASPZODRAFT_18049 [Penicilliopsis zonata CBS 506.65]
MVRPVATILLFSRAIYNVFFHPLSRFPGPVFNAISSLPYCYHVLKGSQVYDMVRLHETYGDIVRIAPNQLYFSHPDAWQDILASRRGEKKEDMEKAGWFYRASDELPPHIVSTTRERHDTLRRAIGPSFAEKAIREQEPVVRKYADLLIDRLSSSSSSRVTISDWYNYTTFDVIGDLAFGESFGCLQASEYHEWIKEVFASIHLFAIVQMMALYPFLRRFLSLFIPSSMKQARLLHKQHTVERLRRRMAIDRQDIMKGFITTCFSTDELISNAELLTVAGSETTASLLSGVTYLLLTNRDKYQKLVAEVRSSFQTVEEINFVSLGQLPYLLACLDEGLRLYPPVAIASPRVVPEQGAYILNTFVPGNTTVAVHQYSLFRRAKYFKHAEQFIPERISDREYASDRRDALQPFSFGPRNCIGKSLAYHEMRLILALMVFTFDMELCEDSRNWMDQKNFLLWQKGGLNIFIR